MKVSLFIFTSKLAILICFKFGTLRYIVGHFISVVYWYSLCFCTLVMMKQLNFLLNTKELGIERHNVGAVVYCSENVPFKEILEQMPNVTKYLVAFRHLFPKCIFQHSR